MKRIIVTISLLIPALWLLHLLSEPPMPVIRAFAREGLYITGIYAWTFMAMAVVIAARPAWLERVTKTPVDRLYLWHKNLGIAAAVFTFLHFFTKDVVGPFLAAAGFERGEKNMVDPFVATLSVFPNGTKGFLESSGEWLTYAGLVLLVITFIAAVKYSRWLTTHRLFSVLFLLLSPHALFLMGRGFILSPLGLFTVLVTIVGCIYSLKVLVNGAGSAKTQSAEITEAHEENGITLLTVRPQKPLTIRPGQFIFLKTKGHEKHPFSVAGINADDTLMLTVKALGDYTEEHVPQLTAGETVTVEGPWGQFFLHEGKSSQVWVAGGIGIAPFLTWLSFLAGKEHGPVRLVWCIRDAAKEPLYTRVKDLAEKARVELTVAEAKNGRLDPETLFTASVPQELAICATDGLSAAVRRAFIAAGGKPGAIRQEHFVWR